MSEIEAVVFDCDGVLWCGDSLIEGADMLIKQLLLSKKVHFVTNNATKDQSQILNK